MTQNPFSMKSYKLKLCSMKKYIQGDKVGAARTHLLFFQGVVFHVTSAHYLDEFSNFFKLREGWQFSDTERDSGNNRCNHCSYQMLTASSD